MNIKRRVKESLIGLIKKIGISSRYAGVPKSFTTTESWCFHNNSYFKELKVPLNEKNILPANFFGVDQTVFVDAMKHTQKKIFLAIIEKGRVWGRNGAVITKDDLLLSDVSREFGKYKGVYGSEHSIFRRLFLGKRKYLKGNSVVLSTAGSGNYYHWIIDVLPRIHILKEAGFFKAIDWFILDYNGLPFQKESLQKVGIPEDKIIVSNNQWKFHVEAEKLYIPSLPSILSFVDKWQVEFLRNLFLEDNRPAPTRKIYISRRKANDRKLLNEKEIFEILEKKGYEIFFPEDFSIQEVAKVMNSATDVVSIHGAGNTNWAFCDEKTNLTEFFPAAQIYPNFWSLACQIKANYQYIISQDTQLAPELDPVVNKENKDFDIKIEDILKLSL